jgi:hypothetical protein
MRTLPVMILQVLGGAYRYQTFRWSEKHHAFAASPNGLAFHWQDSASASIDREGATPRAALMG